MGEESLSNESPKRGRKNLRVEGRVGGYRVELKYWGKGWGGF